MVDVGRVEARVQRLEELIERLDEVHKGGEAAYLADEQRRARPSGGCRLRSRSASTLVLSSSRAVGATPTDYAEVFEILGEKGVIPADRRPRRVRVTESPRRLARLCRQPRTISPFGRFDDRLGRLTDGRGEPSAGRIQVISTPHSRSPSHRPSPFQSDGVWLCTAAAKMFGRWLDRCAFQKLSGEALQVLRVVGLTIDRYSRELEVGVRFFD